MLRQSIIQSVRGSSISARRTITTTALRMAGGDTGAPRSGGVASSDAFTKREDANESMYVRQKENEKLQALKEKIKKHQEHLDELDKHVTDQINASKGQGGSK